MRFKEILTTTRHSSPTFWIVMTIAFAALSIYMGITWYRVKSGNGVRRKSYLAYLTTAKYRERWQRQKANPAYYSIRFWLSLGWTVFSFVKATIPSLR